MTVRFAKENELGRVNELREQVNALHVAGKPDVFKPGFPKELQNYVNEIWNDPDKDIVVAELDGVVCGYAVINYVNRTENPYMFERRYLDIDEFGVDEGFRRRGAATDMIAFIRALAAEKGLNRVELNMWEFNADALRFYEAAGFKTFRRYMETYLDE